MDERPSDLERFGLYASPFRELASDGAVNVRGTHVVQPLDHELHSLKEDAIARRGKATALIIGGVGSGKTQRLRLALAEASTLGIASAHVAAPTSAVELVAGLARGLASTHGRGRWTRLLSPAPRPLRALQRAREIAEPEEAGETLAAAIPGSTFVVIDDFDALRDSTDIAVRTLQAFWSHAPDGLLLLATCQDSFARQLKSDHPTLASRFQRSSIVEPLNDAEASELLARRLAVARVVDDLTPLFPFDEESIGELNRRAGGNPRELLRLSDMALAAGTMAAAYHLDAGFVREALPERERVVPVIAGPDAPLALSP